MKRILLAASFLFLALGNLHATEALMFSGGGYTLYVLIGDGDTGASVAQVRMTIPKARAWLHVPGEELKVETFDEKKQVLVMRFENKNNNEAPPSFSFSAKKKNGVLTIKGKTIKGSFDWLDQ